MTRAKLTIGLFGFGCVGEGLHKVLSETPGLNARIKKICIRHPEKNRSIGKEYFTTDADLIFNDPDINLIVELIDDAQAAYHIVKRSLLSGKPVVTANKKMLATHLAELIDIQKLNNVPLLYEAACCASIPVIRNLEEYYDNDLLGSVEGIVNGSTNFILSKMRTEQKTFVEALSLAQEQGYAESDPFLDISGTDAKYKLLLLIAHAFGLILKPDDIFQLGIDKLGDLERIFAEAKGYQIKLVAQAKRQAGGKLRVFVMPRFVQKDELLYQVNDVFNGVSIESHFCDRQFFLGKGAGSIPTAGAVLSDISALTYDYRYSYKKLSRFEKLQEDENIWLKVFWSYTHSIPVNAGVYLNKIEEKFVSGTNAYVIGNISLKNLKLAISRYPESSFVLFGETDAPSESAKIELPAFAEMIC